MPVYHTRLHHRTGRQIVVPTIACADFWEGRVVNKTKAMKRLGLLWLAGALTTWSLAQAREVYSGRTRGEGLTFEIHALERMPLYLVGWPVWLYWRVVDFSSLKAKPASNR